ncbi:MAG: EFR1 family ferrodoxin [Bacteroidales bacterium]|jgi:ferredoxin|nr:EFR1 family ferrodoxin [Bacteroidales bacterium]
MKIFYFTTTGNCLYIAKNIGGELLSIPQMLKQEKINFKDDVIGFVIPCYGFDVPAIVRKFMEKHSFEADYFFAVMSYGNILATGLSEFEKLANKSNIKLNYTNGILMVDNYLPVFKVEDQLAKAPGRKIDEHIKIIVEDIKNKRENHVEKISMGMKIFSAIIHKYNKSLKPTIDQKFSIDDNCSNCETCAKVCPMNNIIVLQNVEYQHNCSFCLACIHNCPEKAIHIKGEKSASRFRNEHITLKEIITANQNL